MSATEMIWPNFFVVGAAKAGTSSLYFHLKKHPQVFLPTLKEPKYFTPQAMESVSLEKYRRLYRHAAGYRAIGDMSTTYLLDERAPGRILEVSPNARIIVMIRDPVARAYSDFQFARTLGIEPETSIRETLRRYQDRESKEWYLSRYYVEQGMYAVLVRRYQEIFGKDRVLVVLFDGLIQNPRELLSTIAAHIGVDPEFYRDADLARAYNEYRMPKSRGFVDFVRKFHLQQMIPVSLLERLRPLFFDTKRDPLDDESRRLLQDLYDPDVTRLEELLDRKLPELRKSWI